MSSNSAVSNDIYIPPPCLKFRILGYASQQVICPRTDHVPEVGQCPSSVFNPNQWFILIHGDGDKTGLYAIENQATVKRLFSQDDSHPRLGLTKEFESREDIWFKLEAGKGIYAKYFRLVTPSVGMALTSRTNKTPHLFNSSADKIAPEHHFSFIFEDMKVDKIEFDLNLARITSSGPDVVLDKTLENELSVTNEMTVHVDLSRTNSGSFDYSSGFTMSAGTEFHASVPYIADGAFKIDTSMNNKWTWGKTTEYKFPVMSTATFKVGPEAVVHLVSTVNRGVIEVPFTITLRSKSTSVKTKTRGVWRGLSAWDLRHSVQTL